MKAFLFDVDDTLYDQLTPFKLAYDVFERREENISVEKLYRSCRKYSDNIFHKTENGEITLEDMYIYRISKAFDDFGIQLTSDEALAFQNSYVSYQKHIHLLDDVIITLDLLKKNKIKMGIITNGPTQHQKNKIRQLGLSQWIPSEFIFISEEVGIAKPNIEIFKLAEKKMKLNSPETFFIGDSLNNDIIGAKKANWVAIWCNNRQHILPSSEIQPDYIVDERNLLSKQIADIIIKSE